MPKLPIQSAAKLSVLCLAVSFSACVSASDTPETGADLKTPSAEVQATHPEQALTDAETTSAETVATSDADDLVCKLRPQENSRFKRRICLTRAQWKLAAEKARRDTAYTQQRAFSTGW